MPTTENTNHLSSVKNTLKILRAFEMGKPQKGVRELASELNMGKSSVQRILATLASEGFVRKNEETNKYELGVSVLELSSIVLGNLDIYTEAQSIIKSLAEKSKETSHIAIFQGDKVVYLCKEESDQSINLVSYPGLHNYAHCTSSGKLLLAYSRESFVEQIILGGLNKFTDYTITSPEIFKKQLSIIRKNGFSISREEFRKGVTSFSAPIRDHTGNVVAAINIVGPSVRMTNQRINILLKDLIRAGELISEKLGYWKR
ncbi:IclR family transcriptional regulator [Alkalihalobacterium alkalinitrilicum]|uniref:IclR family transcriptional regulator n=1 Tax=Alkalihalobacterium alkalinitrilicum TaxID=427920 RepID=UPI000995553F|nr:IclR family transcriptional regulator [Alkalihalobacterium alkalinitrilicum]